MMKTNAEMFIQRTGKRSTLEWLTAILAISAVSATAWNCQVEEVVIPSEPVVWIVEPENGTAVVDSTVIVVDATDDFGIARIEIIINDIIPPGGILQYYPFQFPWNTSEIADSTVHTIYAKAYDTDSNTSVSRPIVLTSYRFTPTGLTARLAGDTTALLTWIDHSSIETGYEVFTIVNDTMTLPLLALPANTSAASIPGEYRNPNLYTFFVRAKNEKGYSRLSNTQTVIPVLSPPTDLAIISTTPTEIRLQWKLGSQNRFERYIEIEERIDSGPFTLAASEPHGATQTTITRVFKAGTKYEYRVRSVSKYNVSEYSETKGTVIPLAPPLNVRIEHAGTNAVRILWKDNSLFETGYSIQRKTYFESAFSELHRTTANETTWTDIAADPNEVYSYRVSAIVDSTIISHGASVRAMFTPIFEKTFSLAGHSGPVFGLDFLSDGTTAISAGTDGTVRWWNVQSGSPIRTINVDASGIFSLTAIEGRSRIAAGSGDGKIFLFNGTSGVLQSTFTGHTGAVLSLDERNEGKLFASASADSTIRLWAINNGTTLRRFDSIPGTVTVVRFHPQRSELVAGSSDRSLRYWNTEGGEMIWTKSLQNTPQAADFSPDGSTLAAGIDGRNANPLVFYSPSSGVYLFQYSWTGLELKAMSYSPDGKILAAGYAEPNILLWHMSLPFEHYTILSGHTGSVSALCFSPDGSYFVSGDTDGALLVWSVTHQWK